MSITHSECVFVAIVIQHALRLRRILLSCVAKTFFYLLKK
jgi:branched-subunit amino acid transport protein AzlD